VDTGTEPRTGARPLHSLPAKDRRVPGFATGSVFIQQSPVYDTSSPPASCPRIVAAAVKICPVFEFWLSRNFSSPFLHSFWTGTAVVVKVLAFKLAVALYGESAIPKFITMDAFH